MAVAWFAGTLPAQTLYLDYSTYLGGVNIDTFEDITVSSMGEAYLCGITTSIDFPTISAYQPAFKAGGTHDAFVVKFSSAGTLLYSSYLGGTGIDCGRSVALDTANRIFVAGETTSGLFPLVNPYQSSNAGGQDVFISLLSSSGSALIYSTYCGGDDEDEIGGIILNSLGQAYLVGTTASYSFPTVSPYQSTYNAANDAFVSILSSSGSILLYSTFLGGTNEDGGRGLALDSSYGVCLAGFTTSTDFPVRNAYQSTNAGVRDAFVSQFASSGSMLLYSTYCGGSSIEWGLDITLDITGRACVCGWTDSTDWPTAAAYQSSNAGNSDAFVFILSSTGEELSYSTYLGASISDGAYALSLGSDGSLCLAGVTQSEAFPTRQAYQSSRAGAGGDAFLTRFLSSGSFLTYSTYLGGTGSEHIAGLGFDSMGRAYMAGYTTSVDFPTANPYQASYAGGSYDGFLSILHFREPTPPTTPTPVPSPSTSPSPTVAPSPTPWQIGCLGGWTEVEFLNEGFSTWPPTGWTIQTEGMSVCTWQSGAVAGNANNTGGTGNFADANRNYCGGSLQTYLRSPTLDLSLAENPWVEFKSDIYSTAGACCTVLALIDGTTWWELTNICSSQRGPQTYTLPLYGAGFESDVKVVFKYLAFGADMWWQVDDVKVRGCQLILTTPTPTPAPSATPSPAPSPTPSVVPPTPVPPTPVPPTPIAETPSPTPNPTATPIVSPTPTPVKTATPTTEPSASPSPAQSPSPRSFMFFGAGTAAMNGVYCPAGTYNGCVYYNNRSSANYQLRFELASNVWSLCNLGVPQYVLTITEPDPCEQDLTGIWTVSFGSAPPPSCVETNCAPSPTPPAAKSPTPTPAPSPSPTPTCGPSVVPQRAVIQSGDYNGDGADDIGIFRPSAGLWSIRDITRLYFGDVSGQPASGDYDGDGTADVAIYRPSTGLWSISGVTRAFFGGAGDRAVPADFNGDGSCDIATFRENGGMWSIRSLTRFYFGATGDWAIPGDYGNDGTAEAELYRVSSGQWMIQNLTRFYFGGSTDWPVAGDYFGSSVKVFAIFRPCSGQWALKDLTRIYFGNCFDYPRPGDFNGDGEDDFAIFRDSAGMWSVRNITRVYFGSTDDIPVTR
jgi:hypothetical protein